MEQITIRLPENAASRLKAVAVARRVGVNTLVTNWICRALDEVDDEAELRALAKRLDPSMALAVHGQLDRFSQRAKDDRAAIRLRKWKAMRERGKARIEAETRYGNMDQEEATPVRATKPGKLRAPRPRKKTPPTEA